MSMKDSFSNASTAKKVGIGAAVVAGSVVLPHLAILGIIGGAGYAGKALYDNGNKPKQ